jgi:chaperone required for assembly of F1-ATPase
MSDMRGIFSDIFEGEPANPMESARRAMRAPQRRRFYREVDVVEQEGGFAVRLDQRPVRTPARRLLAAPARPLAEAIAAEWDAVGETIDPAHMPLTRLANSIIDGVADAAQPVSDEVMKYLGGDLLFYRADQPEGLVAAQAEAWDPILDWAHKEFGAQFILAEGVMFVGQPDRAVSAIRAVMPGDAWRLGALHSATTLTGSALLSLALAKGRLSPEQAWSAAHVDEDWQMARWGRDEMALQRRQSRWEEMRAAAEVLAALRPR